MGNCIRHESSVQWGGDDWGPMLAEGLLPAESNRDFQLKRAAASAVGEKEGSFRESDHHYAQKATEVKIKITRKQLEELLGRVDVKELTVHQVVAQLLNVSASEMHHQPWRPALQSIPETN